MGSIWLCHMVKSRGRGDLMSSLEKAYLKAMKLKGNDIENVKEIALADSDFHKPLTNKIVDPKELANSKAGISKMSQIIPYSEKIHQEKGIIYANMPDKKLLDIYRTLRTKLLSTSNKENFVTLVTSVVPCENSCMIAANLAVSFALDEAKTSTLVEADIRNPKLNAIFDMENEKGLIDFLESENWESNEILHKTGIPRVRFVSSGLVSENSGEYYTSNKMLHFIEELVSRYPDRYPIINTSSIMNSADTRILFELCDKIVLVVPYGKCSEEEIMQASIAIGEDKLAGVVLDGF